jgi:flagellar M-ring protein FliF
MADSQAKQDAGLGPPLYAQLPPAVRQIALLVGIAAAVAAGVSLVLWSQGPNFTPLYTGLADRDASEIVAAVEAADVEYRLDSATGSVLVPADRKYELRMQLATEGLPRGAGFGLESIPEMGGFGQTPVMENALLQRALETELARTIATVDAVESARIHLAMTEPSAFVRQRRPPSASVLVTLFPGRRLDAAQIQGIVNLVAAAIPDLEPQKVTVLDQSGSLLTSLDDAAGGGLSSSQFQYTSQLESEYAQRIENLLAAVVGPERVRASVAAVLDFTVSEQTRESFDPNVSLLRSEQTSEETRSGEALAQGIPGALTNQPPAAAGEVPPAGAPAEANTTPTSTARAATRNFELDKTISHTRQAAPSVQRLSIGVLIDHVPPASGAGQPEALPDAELASLTELAKQAVGFDEARGDTITVHNSPFVAPPVIRAPEPLALWEQPWVWNVARQALGASLLLVLAFFVVRPMMRTLTRPQPILPVGQLQGGHGGMSALPGGSLALPMGYEDRVAAARSVAGQDPRQVAQVVRNWVAEDNG